MSDCEHVADLGTGRCVKCGEPIVRNAILGLIGSATAAADQAAAMTDRELGELLLSGRWSTVEVHEAGRRLVAVSRGPGGTR